ncbi:MAG: kelch repeat-containing protein [Thermoplasmata archaeon]
MRPIVRARGPRGEGERLRPEIASILFCAVVLLMLTSVGDRPALALRPSAPATHIEAAVSVTFPTPIRHVFVIDMDIGENTFVLQDLAFEKYLSQNFSYASNFYNYCTPQAANYIAINAGTIDQCGNRDSPSGQYDDTNIGSLASAANETWMDFEQGMPTPCDASNATPYQASANPFLYFADIYGNSTVCQQHDVSFQAWYADVNASTTNASAIPNYAFFVPDLADDSDQLNHNSSDSWLAQFVYDNFLRQPFMNDSVLFITYAEGTVYTNPPTFGYIPDPFTGGAVPLFVISPYSVGGPDTALNQTYANDSCPFSLLNTTEYLLGLNSTGGSGQYDGKLGYTAMTGLFNFSVARSMPLPPYNWTLVSSSPSSPSPRSGPAVTYDARDGYVLLFGGQNATSQYNDTWTYQSGTWGKIASATGPSPRAGAALAYDANCGCAVLYGGRSGNQSYSDTWKFQDGVWTNLTSEVGTGPGGLAWASLAYNPETGELVLFGGAYGGVGSNASTYSNVGATWLLTGNLSGTWTQTVQTGPGPAPRDEATLVYDTSLKYVVLFGGQNNTTAMGDTWLLEGQEWTSVPPITSKFVPPEAGAVADYDNALGGVVLFGGSNNTAYLNTTWILLQKTWHLAWAWPGPTQRALAGGAYDPLQNIFVLFGGRVSQNGTQLKDTWVFCAAAPPCGVAPPTYAVTFSEAGLPAGVRWAATLGGATENSTKSSITFAEWDGYYPYHIAPVRGYAPSPSNESVLVSGNAATVEITFRLVSGHQLPVSYTLLEEIGVGVIVLSAVVVFVVLLARRKPPPGTPPPSAPSTRPRPPSSPPRSPPPGSPPTSTPSTGPRPPSSLPRNPPPGTPPPSAPSTGPRLSSSPPQNLPSGTPPRSVPSKRPRPSASPSQNPPPGTPPPSAPSKRPRPSSSPPQNPPSGSPPPSVPSKRPRPARLRPRSPPPAE